ncbi:protein of unknown function [Taphrina deformans PYCC 5710]|uniref:Uncharacterized protein n=1 Tax=Taphrina deformans (strain PYCC 5710 / ATCC 11124 / CBS 356.35 / IMI 108563 / JCM 9778 / NBRC 8474) TaxID=1097556 RepID=R4XKF5_TAPDE|nr:protein of unknown function [Taphrina deformans PYCC 5710]|eukprot:CCG83804.1 protein of unknown function [Taphrina deformans PYCC 5710]
MRSDLNKRIFVLLAVVVSLFLAKYAADAWYSGTETSSSTWDTVVNLTSGSEKGPSAEPHDGKDYLPFEKVSASTIELNTKARALLGDTKVVARVFYGRRAMVEILEVYLRRNLIANGGILTSIEFAWQEGSTQPEDVEYLEHLVAVEPDYISVKGTTQGGYSARYDKIEDGLIYIKIDDDMVYLDDHTVPSMTLALLENPDYKVVSANVVRHPILTHVHARKGALYPFEFVQDDGVQNTADWRTSVQPAGNSSAKSEDYHATQIPVQRYSYLPIRDRNSLTDTPLAHVEYGAMDCSWASPYCSVHCHMSFFRSKEEGTLGRYDFGTWDMHLMFEHRYSVNLIAWRGRYVFEGLHENEAVIPADDEHWIAVEQVRRTGNHHVAIGDALTSHLAYGQPQGYAWPDYDIIIQKYKSLAKDTCRTMREWTTDTWHA